MRRTQRLLTLVSILALLVPCFGAAVAEDGGDKKTPAPAKDVYTYDGVNYYNVYKNNPKSADHFDLPELFLPEMLSAKILDKDGKDDSYYSMADRWMWLGMHIKEKSQESATEGIIER